MDEKQLLPISTKDMHTPEVMALRDKTERLMLRFNATGEKGSKGYDLLRNAILYAGRQVNKKIFK